MKIIELNQGLQAFVDDDVFVDAAQFHWYADLIGKTYYAATKVQGRKLYLHRYVMQAGDKQLVDHEDCNGLNCQRSNLRFLSKGENTMRRGPMNGGFKGISYEKARGKWNAKHTDDVRGTVNLGRFKTAVEAARAYDTYIRCEFGELAYTNFHD